MTDKLTASESLCAEHSHKRYYTCVECLHQKTLDRAVRFSNALTEIATGLNTDDGNSWSAETAELVAQTALDNTPVVRDMGSGGAVVTAASPEVQKEFIATILDGPIHEDIKAVHDALPHWTTQYDRRLTETKEDLTKVHTTINKMLTRMEALEAKVDEATGEA